MPARKKADAERVRPERRPARPVSSVRCGYWDPVWTGPDGKGCSVPASHDVTPPAGAVFADGSVRILLCDYHYAESQIGGSRTRRQLLGDDYDPPERWRAPDGTVWESA
jgi:hypothetical protein